YLGPARFDFGVAELEDQIGAVTGVAVNEYGGDVMTVEAIAMNGRGEFALTGQIGKVMEESARAAVSYARAHAAELGVRPAFFDEHFFHIHVPAGAIPKDGPSAGITMEGPSFGMAPRSEEHTSELQSQSNLVCRLLLEKKKTNY